MSPANLLQMAGLNPLLELCLNLLQKIKFQVRSIENYFKTSKAGPQELLIARLQKASLVARALSAVKRFGWLSRVSRECQATSASTYSSGTYAAGPVIAGWVS